ncbi:hypothetical protein NADFUDRAFT_81158 [Nadsonia fulvescens var. elongata DSM 6958]|uniref:Uncharacterized protein n=1 Tax=Nadsonia fulvescens var. elongata DSM 6958 TaxID=857566 RepID=A0A1E3PS21_9ASCO|nr:hypothetical protein NADFUDRAFT_81158 [Nadsonia fulvescens var. elongata DSM 6958]
MPPKSKPIHIWVSPSSSFLTSYSPLRSLSPTKQKPKLVIIKSYIYNCGKHLYSPVLYAWECHELEFHQLSHRRQLRLMGWYLQGILGNFPVDTSGNITTNDTLLWRTFPKIYGEYWRFYVSDRNLTIKARKAEIFWIQLRGVSRFEAQLSFKYHLETWIIERLCKRLQNKQKRIE